MRANDVGPDYLRTLGIPILQGRDIQDSDSAHRAESSHRQRNIREAVFSQERPLGPHRWRREARADGS